MEKVYGAVKGEWAWRIWRLFWQFDNKSSSSSHQVFYT